MAKLPLSLSFLLFVSFQNAVADTFPKQALGTGAQGITFVANEVCEECHAQQFKEWQPSHHARAMQVATKQTVLGNFDQATFTDNAGVTSHFFKKADKFFIHTEHQLGKFADFEVQYTFGVDPLQQYLLTLPNSKLQAFTIAWDVKNRKWFDLYPNEKVTPNDPLHWSQRHHTWNSFCAECHSTNLQLNYDAENKRYQTTWSEINVSCQACHGPGQKHVAWAKEQSKSDVTKGLIVDYAQLNSQQTVDTCARCHSRRYPVSANDQHGQDFLNDFVPELLRQGLYYPDGQILEEVYVYASFKQSKMYRQGVQCMDCHNPHSLQLKQEGNAVCTICHQQTTANPKFPTLVVKAYDSSNHHFHKPDSPGAQCVNCHMPVKNYMVVDPRHDHSFRVPRPDLSVTLGVPNTCNQCHTDKEPQWTVDTMAQWYGKEWQTPHFASIIAAAQQGLPQAKNQLIELVQDETQSDMVRATGIDLLWPYGEEGLNTTLDNLDNSSPLVRTIAAKNLSHLPESQATSVAKRLLPLLKDAVKAVRIHAAKSLATLPGITLDKTQQADFEAALEEYKTAQLALNDQPEGYLNLAQLYAAMGKLDLAEQYYLTAMKQDERFLPTYNALANLYYQTNRLQQAEQIFSQSLKIDAKQGNTHYSLGLLLAQQKRLPEAEAHLKHATMLLPKNAKVLYNYGLLQQQLGKVSDASYILRKAHHLAPKDIKILYALVMLFAKEEQWDIAYGYAEKYAQLAPFNPKIAKLLAYLKNQMESK